MPMAANFGDVNNDGYPRHVPRAWGARRLPRVLPHELLLNKARQVVRQRHGIVRHRRAAQRTRHRVCRPGPRRRRGHRRRDRRCGARRSSRAAAVRESRPGQRLDQRAPGRREEQPVGDRRADHGHRGERGRRRRRANGPYIGPSAAAARSAPTRWSSTSASAGGARSRALEIWWPASRTRQTFANVAKNQFIEIRESAKDYTKLARRTVRLGGGGRK